MIPSEALTISRDASPADPPAAWKFVIRDLFRRLRPIDERALTGVGVAQETMDATTPSLSGEPSDEPDSQLVDLTDHADILENLRHYAQRHLHRRIFDSLLSRLTLGLVDGRFTPLAPFQIPTLPSYFAPLRLVRQQRKMIFICGGRPRQGDTLILPSLSVEEGKRVFSGTLFRVISLDFLLEEKRQRVPGMEGAFAIDITDYVPGSGYDPLLVVFNASKQNHLMRAAINASPFLLHAQDILFHLSD